MPIEISTDVDLAVERLRSGGLVALPTETVYGLAADAAQPDAVARIFEVKGRPADHPLIVHVAGAERIDEWAVGAPDAAHVLARACWPGPLTMLLPCAEHVDRVVTGGRDTIGLRAPSHPVAQAVIESLGSGLAAPSANRFGRVSPTTAEHVRRDLDDHLDVDRDLILDGGPSTVGVESTIIDLTVTPPQMLRHGAITADELHRLLDTSVDGAAGPSRASGMLASHYAPSCDVIAVERRDEADETAQHLRDVGRRVDVLDRTGDLVEAARRLYADLREADDRGLDTLVVVLPAPAGLGHALRDRITKAAAATPDRSSRAR